MQALRSIWVPSHTSITENEKADELTREGSNKKYISPDPDLGLSNYYQNNVSKLYRK